ncbi:unnamed protein product [Ilex paraguariensis]|uniref:Uncharacterized protein n=1 Tax=Ilex paraguariensis TaxID=185542 RepID=A0ABC8SL09_9AQUA
MYIPHRFARQHEFHQRLLGKGKSLPIVAKAPSSLRKRDTSKDCLNSQEQPVPKMLKVTTPVSRSANVRFVHPLNIPESTEDIGSNCGRIPSAIVPVDNLGFTKQALQERCQIRATEAEHNLACVRLEDGANHSTIKSLTSRVDPSCDALNDLSNFLELSPRSRNKVDNLGSTKQALQERCQTRATEAEHNLACVRLDDGANHSTIKSLTSRVNPSCDALKDLSTFLELSPRSRNKAFPPLPDLATLNSIPAFPPLPNLATLNSIPGICGDQNLDNDIIGALFDDNDRTMSILSGSGEIFPLVDGENANPCEGEVNSKTNPSCAIQARQEAINNSVRNTLPEPYGPGEAQSPRLMPMFSSVSGIFH